MLLARGFRDSPHPRLVHGGYLVRGQAVRWNKAVDLRCLVLVQAIDFVRVQRNVCKKNLRRQPCLNQPFPEVLSIVKLL